MPTISRCASIGRQRQAGADADLEHAALALVDDLDGVLAALGGDAPEGVVVDRRPAAVGAFDGVLVHLRCTAVCAILESLEELRRALLFGTQRRPHDSLVSLDSVSTVTTRADDLAARRRLVRRRILRRLLGPARGALDPSAAQHTRSRTGIGVEDAGLARRQSPYSPSRSSTLRTVRRREQGGRLWRRRRAYRARPRPCPPSAIGSSPSQFTFLRRDPVRVQALARPHHDLRCVGIEAHDVQRRRPPAMPSPRRWPMV